MLEKNKDYVEFILQSTSVDYGKNKTYAEVGLNGYSDAGFPSMPMDVVCKEFNHQVVLVSKSDFDRLQTENEQLKQKLHEFDPMPDYKELLKELYSTEDVEKLEWTLNHICGGRGSANGWMATARFWRQNYETLSKLVGFSSVEEIQDYLTNEAEADTLYEAISKLKDQVKYTCDEWYSANSRNNSWKAAAECNSPKELIEKLSLLRDDISGRITVIESYKRDIEKWQEATGYSTPEGFESAMLNDPDNVWRDATGCNSPLEANILIRNYKVTIDEWKDVTKCRIPEAAKECIDSGMSWHHAYNEVKEKNQKLTDEVESWKHVTEYSTPEDYLHARINDAAPFDYTAAWQEATGCNTPDKAKKRIKALNERIDESEACYDHLLMLTGFGDEGEIEDALDKCDHSTLRKALVDYEFDYEALLKFTGYKSEHDIRVMLNNSEQFVYENMRELINSLKRKVEFTESNWQNVTGFSTQEKCSSYIDTLEKKLKDIKDLIEED